MFRIGTPAIDSPVFEVAGLVANGLSNPPGGRPCDRGGACGVPGLIAAVQALSGVSDALEQVTRRQIDGVVLSVSDAIRGFEQPGNPLTALRTVGTLFVEELHLLVAAGNGALDLADLVGEDIAVGLGQGQPSALLRDLVPALGFAPDRARFMSITDAVAAVASGRVHAAMVLATWPQPWLNGGQRLRLIPLSAAQAAGLIAERGYLVPRQVPITLVEGGPLGTTIGAPTQLFVPADSDIDLVYQLARSLWHPATLRMLGGGSVEAKDAKPAQALAGVRVPLHLGAQRWYRESGLLPTPRP